MKFGKRFICATLVFGLAMTLGSSADGHSVFKKEMDKKYPEMKISCNACHVAKAKKTERNAFGQLFAKQLSELELSKNWSELKGAEKKTYETDVMVPAFEKALTSVTAMTYDDIIKAGMVAGIDDPNAPSAEDGDGDE